VKKRSRGTFTPKLKADAVRPRVVGSMCRHQQALAGSFTKADFVRLRREAKQLEMERETSVIGGEVLREVKPMRFAFIQSERETNPINLLCRMMQVTRSGYHASDVREECEHIL